MPVAATVFLAESNGVGEVVTDDVDNCNLGGIDMPNIVPANHPIVRTDAVINLFFYAFQKYWRVKVQSMGDSLLITDTRWWKALGAYIDGESMLWAGGTTAYATPALAASGVAIPTSDPAAQNIYIAGLANGTFIAPGYSNYIRVSWKGNDSMVTPIGAVNQKTIVFTYDES